MAYRVERIFVVTVLIVVGLGFMSAIDRGLVGTDANTFSLMLWLLTGALVLLAIAGTLWVSASSQPVESGGSRSEATLAVYSPRLPLVNVPLEVVVPGLLVVGFVLFLRLFDSTSFQAVLVLPAGLAFAGVLWAQMHGRNTGDRYFAIAQSALNIISHLTAFLLFSVIYGLKVRALFSATAVALVSALLLLELMSRDAAWHEAMSLPVEGRRSTIVLLALAGGLIAGELTWGLNYWAALSTLVGGAFLLVVFYVIHGIASHYVDRKLTRRVFIEFGTVGALGLAVIFVSAFLS